MEGGDEFSPLFFCLVLPEEVFGEMTLGDYVISLCDLVLAVLRAGVVTPDSAPCCEVGISCG